MEDNFQGRLDRLDREGGDVGQLIGLPVAEYAYHRRAYSAIVYGKGPLFFIELADEVGEDVLIAGLQEYLKRNRYGVAEPADLLSVLEEVSGRQLDGPFAEWVGTFLGLEE